MILPFSLVAKRNPKPPWFRAPASLLILLYCLMQLAKHIIVLKSLNIQLGRHCIQMQERYIACFVIRAAS